jgi:hypothetical protein
MNKETEKHLDNLVSNMMKEVSLETPSENFEANVMANINKLSVRNALTYKPLISKSTWLLLAFCFMTLMGYLIFGVTWQDSESAITINFDVLFNNKFTQSFGNLEFSNIFTYAILSLAFMLLIQITFLKNYFDKRLAL